MRFGLPAGEQFRDSGRDARRDEERRPDEKQRHQRPRDALSTTKQMFTIAPKVAEVYDEQTERAVAKRQRRQRAGTRRHRGESDRRAQRREQVEREKDRYLTQESSLRFHRSIVPRERVRCP